MSVDSKGSNGAPAQTADGVSAEANPDTTNVEVNTSSKDTVAYETYKKTLSALKKKEAMFEEVSSEKQKLLEEKLQLEGKKDELIESYKKKLAEVESKHKKAVGSYAYNSLSRSIENEAVKAGCINVKDLIQLSDLTSLEIDDEFNANGEQVKTMIETARKERPYLFNKAVSTAKTGIPQSMNGASLEPDWKKLSPKDQAMMAIKLMDKK